MKNCDAQIAIKNGGLSLIPKSTKSQIWKVCSKEVVSFVFQSHGSALVVLFEFQLYFTFTVTVVQLK